MENSSQEKLSVEENPGNTSEPSSSSTSAARLIIFNPAEYQRHHSISEVRKRQYPPADAVSRTVPKADFELLQDHGFEYLLDRTYRNIGRNCPGVGKCNARVRSLVKRASQAAASTYVATLRRLFPGILPGSGGRYNKLTLSTDDDLVTLQYYIVQFMVRLGKTLLTHACPQCVALSRAQVDRAQAILEKVRRVKEVYNRTWFVTYFRVARRAAASNKEKIVANQERFFGDIEVESACLLEANPVLREACRVFKPSRTQN